MRSLISRVEQLESRAERLLELRSTLRSDCICFPEGQEPAVGFPILQEIAFFVKCPLHGDRFRPGRFIYVSKWMREKLHKIVSNPASSFFSPMKRPEQYRKAYFASFPLDLFPGNEEREEIAERHSKTFLLLKDGTRIQVSEDKYYKSRESREDPAAARAHALQWRSETLRTLARLLSKGADH
ncbi:MAG: hypothetical protein JWN45_2510 [Acidobacteriaceae bacterium]|nr:hypothetical protein [Acidobacteriaceae bacterium]